MPTIVAVGAASPIFVRLASGWILMKKDRGSRTAREKKWEANIDELPVPIYITGGGALIYL